MIGFWLNLCEVFIDLLKRLIIDVCVEIFVNVIEDWLNDIVIVLCFWIFGGEGFVVILIFFIKFFKLIFVDLCIGVKICLLYILFNEL